MYCVKCGVELAEGEKLCPLCGIEVYHPRLGNNEGKRSYPISKVPSPETLNKNGILLLISLGFIAPLITCLICDMAITSSVSWSGYVIGGLILLYISSILPSWFKKPNPVIFIPIFFAAVVLYLLYIDIATGNEWFLSFAFPVVGAFGVIITAITAVCRYVKKGYWYIASASIFSIGAYTVLIEFLLYITFGFKTHIPWSVYPLVSCILIGGALIIIAINKPLRRSIQKKFFI